jgi:uncharacterized protein YegJ (DUF2314 family)
MTNRNENSYIDRLKLVEDGKPLLRLIQTQEWLKHQDVAVLVGGHVKLPFYTGMKSAPWERLWVHVVKVNKNTLVGRVANHPKRCDDVRLGDRIVISPAEIEDVRLAGMPKYLS